MSIFSLYEQQQAAVITAFRAAGSSKKGV